MRKYLALLMTVLMAACLTACDGNRVEGKAPDKSELKVGAIYITSQYDTAGYTFAHHHGIVTAMGELGLSHSEREKETDAGQLAENLRQLKTAGFRIILDDYGNGVTSENDLTQDPMD